MPGSCLAHTGVFRSSPYGSLSLLGKYNFWYIFWYFSRKLISAQKQDTMAILLKTALVRISCIQNTQVRGQILTKRFGKVDTFWTYHLPQVKELFLRAIGSEKKVSLLGVGKSFVGSNTCPT